VRPPPGCKFQVAEHEIEGEILLYFEGQSLEGLLAALDQQILGSMS
jgi:hypothetical protein